MPRLNCAVEMEMGYDSSKFVSKFDVRSYINQYVIQRARTGTGTYTVLVYFQSPAKNSATRIPFFFDRDMVTSRHRRMHSQQTRPQFVFKPERRSSFDFSHIMLHQLQK